MSFDELNLPFRDFVGAFERLNIPYALIGGLAVGVHGIPRPTHDLDFTIAVDRARLPEFLQAVIELGYDVPQEFTTGWVDQVAGMPLVKARLWVEGKAIDVDVFLAESRFQKSLIQRRILTEVEGITVWIASAEDLILLKLIAGRPRDLGDIQDILLVQGPLDETYLHHWADELGVRPQLTKALEDFTR
jgi:hypothetical protein